jgi:septum formation protein
MMHKHLTLLSGKHGIVLGSKSPRRVKLLTETGVSFRQIIPGLEEKQINGEQPYEYAERLARDKAILVSGQLDENEIVIACDTVVVLGDVVLGKPNDVEEAVKILSSLSGKKHVVCTALAIGNRSDILASGYELTGVRFNEVDETKIREYIATGEPMDKAGAYGIQGMGAFLVDSIEGNLDTVIGFPRMLLEKLAQEVMEQN